MSIDWFTILAQVLNFLILVWLMKRYLYKPILHAIDEREKRIAAELASADKKKEVAQKEGDTFKQKNKEFDAQRTALLNKATEEAQTERKKRLDEVRQEATTLREQWQQTAANEERNLHDTIRNRTQQQVFLMARKALADLAGVSVEERMVIVFIRQLRGMQDSVKKSLRKAFDKDSTPAVIRSAFTLSTTQRTSIQHALDETFLSTIHTQFEIAPALIGGIELTSNGQKIAWSISNYLTLLEKNVTAANPETKSR